MHILTVCNYPIQVSAHTSETTWMTQSLHWQVFTWGSALAIYCHMCVHWATKTIDMTWSRCALHANGHIYSDTSPPYSDSCFCGADSMLFFHHPMCETCSDDFNWQLQLAARFHGTGHSSVTRTTGNWHDRPLHTCWLEHRIYVMCLYVCACADLPCVLGLFCECSCPRLCLLYTSDAADE